MASIHRKHPDINTARAGTRRGRGGAWSAAAGRGAPTAAQVAAVAAAARLARMEAQVVEDADAGVGQYAAAARRLRRAGAPASDSEEHDQQAAGQADGYESASNGQDLTTFSAGGARAASSSSGASASSRGSGWDAVRGSGTRRRDRDRGDGLLHYF